MRKTGFVYVISLGYDWLFKIGKTTDVVSRLKTLQASNPRAVKVLCVWVNNCSGVESELHKRYKRKRYSREIFQLDTQDIKNIEDYLKSQTPSAVKARRDKRKIQEYHKKMELRRRSKPSLRTDERFRELAADYFNRKKKQTV